MGKICNKCYIEKELDEYHKCRRSKDGYKSICKKCRKIETKDYYNKNTELLKEKSQIYRFNNSDKIKRGLKKYRIKNLEKVRKKNREWSKSDNGKKSKKKYYEKNSEIIRKKIYEYRKKNPDVDGKRRKTDKRKNYMKLYRKVHREKKTTYLFVESNFKEHIKKIRDK